VIAVAVFSYYNQGILHQETGYLKYLNGLTGLVFAFWLTFSIYLSVRLMVSSSFREKVLSKLTFIRERDEREALLTGKATKATFLASIAVLFFLFFLSCFQVSIYRLPPEKLLTARPASSRWALASICWITPSRPKGLIPCRKRTSFPIRGCRSLRRQSSCC
jgi:hypothetical protein